MINSMTIHGLFSGWETCTPHTFPWSDKHISICYTLALRTAHRRHLHHRNSFPPLSCGPACKARGPHTTSDYVWSTSTPKTVQSALLFLGSFVDISPSVGHSWVDPRCESAWPSYDVLLIDSGRTDSTSLSDHANLKTCYAECCLSCGYLKVNSLFVSSQAYIGLLKSFAVDIWTNCGIHTDGSG